jgi:nucleoid DNA-binding protein
MTEQRQSLPAYLEERLGINTELAKRIVWALREYILLTLSDTGHLTLRGLGTFSLSLNDKRRRIKFTASDELYKYLDDVSRTTGKKLITSDVQNRVQNAILRKFNKLKKELPIKNAPLSNTQSNVVRLSFLKYLQQEFPYNQNWEHPISKTVYSYSEVMKAVTIYQRLCSDNLYVVLWALWVSISARMKIAKYFNLSPGALKLRWERGVDSILFIITHPELHPSNLKILLNKEELDVPL